VPFEALCPGLGTRDWYLRVGMHNFALAGIQGFWYVQLNSWPIQSNLNF
jgi:hypothetical protein